MTKSNPSIKIINQHGPMGFVLFVAFIGAAVYFVQHSSGFWGFIWAIVQALVWPGFVVFHVLQVLKV